MCLFKKNSFLILLISIWFFFFSKFFFFNLVPHHLISFYFCTKFIPRSFNCYLFYFYPFPNWIVLSILSFRVWFWFIFISYFVFILFNYYMFCFIYFFYCFSPNSSINIYWLRILLHCFLKFAFLDVSLKLMTRVVSFRY